MLLLNFSGWAPFPCRGVPPDAAHHPRAHQIPRLIAILLSYYSGRNGFKTCAPSCERYDFRLVSIPAPQGTYPLRYTVMEQQDRQKALVYPRVGWWTRFPGASRLPWRRPWAATP